MKKLLLLVIITLFIFLGGGCMRNEFGFNEFENNAKTAEDYLSIKYGGEFSFVSIGDDVWSSKSKSLIFVDNKGRNFTVKENSGYFTDNYCSVLFDASASEYVKTFFGEDTKVYVNTQSFFLPSTRKFDDITDYLKDCSVINIAIFTTQIEQYEAVAEKLLTALNDCSISAVVYCIDSDDFMTVTEYKSSVNIVASGSFWIENNEIFSRSWEEQQ